MNIYLAADHRGFNLKEIAKQYLSTTPNQITDCGATVYNPDDDFIDFGQAALNQVNEDDRAILFCGSGHGMDMLANRYKHIRAILGFNQDVVKQGREHENANVLVIPADWLKAEDLPAYIDTFLTTPASENPRYTNRLTKLAKV
jgi:ribose 5-phosphate isomerase B